jgi:hypothetical protein
VTKNSERPPNDRCSDLLSAAGARIHFRQHLTRQSPMVPLVFFYLLYALLLFGIAHGLPMPTISIRSRQLSRIRHLQEIYETLVGVWGHYEGNRAPGKNESFHISHFLFVIHAAGHVFH